MSTPENPFASPPEIDDDAVVEVVEEAEQIRRQYLRHERAVRSIGDLYFLVGFLLMLGAVCAGSAAFMPTIKSPGTIVLAGVAILQGFLAAATFSIWGGLHLLARKARISAGVVSAFGLFVCPLGAIGSVGFSPAGLVVGLIGTVINGSILYLLFCRKGQMVFSPEYREVMRQTAHMRYKSYFTWIVLAVLLTALIWIIQWV